MSINQPLPSYQEQFGLTFLDGDAARSVCSPAAYFADLLQLLEDYFQSPDLTVRRTDLTKIPLDAENTVTLVPYLDVVNGLLAGNIDDPFETLRNASYPFNLPFNLEDERAKLLMNESGLDRVALYKLFQLRPEAATIARLALGLSPEVCQEVVLTPHDTAEAVQPFYHHTSFSEVADIETFLKVSALSADKLRELLSHNLHIQEESKAGEFFIHHELGGYVRIDSETFPDRPRLVWVATEEAGGAPLGGSAVGDDASRGDIPILWFSRVNRIVRLATQSGLSISGLNLILCTCCDHTLDAIALQRIAIIKHISDSRELSIDEVCGLFSDDLDNAQALPFSGDLFLTDNAEVRGQLMRLLHFSISDLQLIETTFKQQVGETELYSSASRRRSLYHRIKKLSEALDLPVKALFDLLDILQKDPAIRRYSDFLPLIHIEITTLNGYQILLNGAVDDAMWLIQMLLSLSDWMATSQFTPAELKAIQTGQYASSIEQTADLQRQITGFNDLYQQLKPVLFTPDFFRAQVLEEKLARAVYSAVIDPQHSLVSVKDHRLLSAEADQAELAMYQALNSLHWITVEDFLDLGLEEKVQAKMLTSLMLGGYIQPDGLLVEAMWPAQADDLVLCKTYDSEAVFERLYAIRLATVADSPVGLVEFSIFLTDLMDGDLPGGAVALGLSEAQAKDLYDNLIFNGYIDEAGTALTADFFAQMKNAYEFEANSGLAQYKNDVYAVVEKKKIAFAAAPCRIEKSLFSALPLQEIEIVDLIENLRFNDYIDEDGQVLNKSAMLALSVHDFKLVLAYYPHRHQILSVIQDHITTLKQQHLTLAIAGFESLGQQIVARDVYQVLIETALEDEQFTLAAIVFFQDLENINAFTLPRYFDSGAHTVVFKAIQQLITLSQAYRLHLDSFVDLGFSEDEVQNLIDLMIEQGYVSKAGTFSTSQADYFLNINNALVIDLPGYEDFAKDIFFVVHALAKKIQATVQDLLSAYALLAQEQSDILFFGLQDLFEIPANLVKVICHHIFHQSADRVEQFAVPLLAAVNEADQIVHSPGSHRFQVAFSRIQQFAWLAAKLDLDEVETDIVFRDQSLVEKFSEKLALPNGINRIDCLVQIWVDGDAFAALEHSGAVKVLMMVNAAVERYWLYDIDSYALLSAAESDVSKLSPLFQPNQPIHAAFNDEDGNAWLISRTAFFCQKAGELTWERQDKTLGDVRSNFGSLERIDAAFVDRDRKIYLFAGDQYLRSSSNLSNIDEGYPKQIQGNWPAEHSFDLPEKYHQSINAAFSSPDETLYFFKGDTFISSDDFLTEADIVEQWGQVKNNFASLEKLDAALALDSRVYFFSGDQCATWSYSVENADGVADEGSIQSLSSLIAGLPAHFQVGIDAAFKGADNKIRLFKGGHVLTCNLDFNLEGDRTELATELAAEWGRVRNSFANVGQISAAFAGLDGNVYLFSQDQYVRYASGNYAYVDEGYPKQIAGDWGGLNQVDAAFILDGKTYLIGRNKAEALTYVRYSTNDYAEADTDYPKPASASWWMDRFNLEPHENADFTQPDTVFMGRDGVTYLFKGDRYIAYDKLHRWWSQPQLIAGKWAGMSFDVVDAAFTGKDGRTYLFSGTAAQYLRYSDPYFNRLDDRYPQQNKSLWGRVKNSIVETNHIDAAVTMESVETITQNEQAREVTRHYTYLFSGLQFFRYTGDSYSFVDEGYPKAIASLSQEPRFTALTAPLTDPIDAAFADQRNAYLFSNQQCTVVATTAYRHYETVTAQPITAVLQDEGKLYTHHNGTWHTLKGIEGTPLSEPALVPPLLRGLPSNFQQNISAAFVGADKTTYVFRGDQCYNATLEKAYPLTEEWGRQRNRIALENRVDAAFAGTDGKTYLFSGDQYVVYTAVPTGSSDPVFTDAHPMPIADRWGGLSNVNVAFVRAGKTYLVEAPDEQGQFRYVCYSAADYSQPDQAPQTVDISWWEFPSIYLEEGFDHVDAVLFDDERMYLLKGDQFLQYNQTEGMWTYPRPLSRIWRDLPFTESAGQTVMAVFKGHNGVTYFFSDRHATSDADFANLQLTSQVWGRTNNNLLENARIDAAVVADGEITYIFSGDQYVRYSTSDYRFVDEGYPKAISTDLVNESAFAHIPASVSDHLATSPLAISPLSGITANQRTVYIFSGQDCHACSKERIGAFGIARIGAIKNELRSRQKVDAAFVNDNRQTLLFSGDQYVRYSQGHYDVVDEGYPKSVVVLAEDVPGIDATRLSEGLVAGLTLDAAVQFQNSVQIFQGDTVHRSGAEDVAEGGAIALAEIVPTQTNRFANGVDAAFVAADGKAYFFKGSHYLRYTDINSDHPDESFPKTVRDNWGNLPADFETAVESAFVFEEKTYLVRGEQYVRYSDAHYQMIDAIYPQAFVFRWGNWNDYLLSDIKIIADFKALLEQGLSTEYTLRDLLNLEQGYQTEPYRMLSEIFGWEIDEIKWLKRRNAFYKDELDIEVNFNIELILKMRDIFAIARKANTIPAKLYAIAQNDASGQFAAAAETLYQGLKMKHSEPDWQLLSAELHNKINLLKRDALLPYVIAQDDSVENARDLFAKMLVDVEMGNEAKTSRIKEAISAVQLYLHRYFVNLESIPLNGSAERAELKQWWQWMRNYRVWEANRKVFLYPENYIRPELRDSKTAAFKKLEEDLLQGEVSAERVAIAFNDYLKEFSTVGNLKITGANVHSAQGDTDETLVLFGHTRTEPTQYYYRSAQFLEKDDAIWGNWLPVNITVNSTRVFPIHAFGRIMVFWSEIEAYEESVPFISTKNSADRNNADATSKVEDTDTVLKHKADIKYSFYDFNKQWVTPQTLKQGVEIEYKIDAAYTNKDEQLVVFAGEYCLISTVQNPQGALRKISEVYPTLPAAFHLGLDAAVRFGDRIIFFRDGQCAISSDEAARWTQRSIIEYFRPDVPILKYTLFTVLWWARYIVSSVTATGQFDNPYRWGIAAAFPIDGRVCLVDHQGMPLFFLPTKDGFQEEEIAYVENQVVHGAYSRTYTLVHEFSRIITRNFMRLEPVDAVFEDEHNIIYVMRKGQYECYRHNQNSFERLEKLDGFPKPIKGNLSFNMDKFFNRLHLATTRQKGRDVIRLTFTSPKANTTLLTGVVQDDFTFVEGDLRTDYQQQTILRFSQGLLTVPDVSRLPGSIDDYASVLQAVEDAIANANRINTLESAQNLVASITDGVADVIRAQETLPSDENEAAGSKYVVPQAVQNELYHLLDRPQGVIATFDHGPEGWTVGTDLRAAFAAYVAVPEDSRGWIQEFNQLQQTNQTLRTLIEDNVPALLAALRLRISLIERDQLVPLRDWLQQTLSDYQNTASTFDQQLSDIRQLISAFDEFFPAENTLVPSTATNIRQLKLEIAESSRRLFAWVTPTRVMLTALPAIEQHLNSVHERLSDLQSRLSMLNGQIIGIRPDLQQLISRIKRPAERLREVYFGSSDAFPSAFEIENQTNFTFGEPDWHIFEAKGGTFLCKPENVKQARVGARERLDQEDSDSVVLASTPVEDSYHRIIRLTTTTIPVLSKNLFLGGVDQLLTLASQQEDEKPDFSPATNIAPSALTIHYNRALLIPPDSDNLDYKSANATYYWEIFFHVPSLIAQTLNQAQQFEAAKTWYEYIFDPTAIAPSISSSTSLAADSTDRSQRDPRWQFLPFTQAPDPTRTRIEDYLHRTLDIANLQAEVQVYLSDPFDPHAIARIREIAYQKATMMAYIDNLLDWGDMLFRQYTVESINEARMLYILAYDLLGTRPAVLGEHRLPAVSDYEGLQNPTANETDLLVGTELAISNGTVHRSVQSPYFFIPDNDLFLDYWNRVEDRLYKIRQSLNIDGIKQSLPLFQPPLDPLAIVKAIAGGASLSQIAGDSAVAVPHYRFSFMFYKAKELVQKLSQFSGELLTALEKQDSEQLGLMQHRQEATILSMMTEVKTAQIAEAEWAIASLQAGLAMVEANEAYNQSTVDDGFLPYETAQMSVMGGAVVAHAASAILRTIASFGGAAPDALVGPFIAGIKIGGAQAYSSLSSASEVLQTVAEGLSIGGEIFGIVAQHERLMADVQHQVDTAIHDKNQIQAQIAGAQQQLKMAEYELAIHQKEIAHHKSVATFMTSKFSNQQLYQWMSGQLSGLYYQSYKMAHDMAKSAEKAFQFERGLPASEVSYINGMYWNSARKGLLAGDSLGLDLDRMEQSFLQTDSRRFEISKPISLLSLDPLAFLQLKAQGACEFELSEALFDYDFAGHYCRQIKSIEVSFDAASGETVNATLTQLNHKMVLKADPKAVKYLIDPKGGQPLALRSDWRVSQQIALSHVDEYEKGHGLFERRYEDDRYLPFEGTGAVSRWRLALNGKRGAVTLDQLLDVTITLKYTALQGGEKFADAVKGLLKPYDTVSFLDLNYDFHEAWLSFLESDARSVTVEVDRSLFPNMASGRITGIFTKFQLAEPAQVSLVLNNDDMLVLKDEQFLETPGLSISSSGSRWTFTVQGDKSNLKTVQMVVGYKAKV